ncbi:unnamed protein product, partial [Rotaria sordida]
YENSSYLYRQKLKINPKLEDFRLDGASFPQQFFPTKSNYTPEAIVAAIAKNSNTSNSLKPNGEQYLNGAKLYTRFVFLLFCLKKNGAHIFSSGFRFI